MHLWWQVALSAGLAWLVLQLGASLDGIGISIFSSVKTALVS